mmetsp:Transcript_10040/g.20068  ORF Transcript_10040/g.20068 Transcript_10040/m.20068 type:complete len:251 (+) Transcript_10040:2139-2891(+)
MHVCMDFVTTSARNTAFPLSFRAARPTVWIRDRDDRRNPSLSASITTTSDTCGKSNPSLNKFTPTSTWSSPRCSSSKTSARSCVVNPECRYLATTPCCSSHDARSSASFFVIAITSDLSPCAMRALTSSRRASSCPALGHTSISGSSTLVGLITMSTMGAWPPHCPDSCAMSTSRSPGVALTKRACSTLDQNSWSLSGRLSSALGSRKPWRTKFSFRALSAAYMPLSCGSVTWLSSTTRSHPSLPKAPLR